MTMRSAEGAPSPPSYARIGEVLGGKYRIERVLGRGGMGIVVSASHVKLRQPVAIKFLLPSSLGAPQLATRLLREARAAAALKSEHVARVFDVDVVDGAPYIVMEYLEGQTLASLLEANGPLAAELTVDYALEACEALAEAHALGIVHRDLKPSNLFLARGPGGRRTLRVLDFGISKAFDGGDGEPRHAAGPVDAERDVSTFSGTDSHTLVGSPPYVSPEQLIRPREADARSDIWSLGVVLYQCLSGRLPFRADTLTALWDSILRKSMPPLEAGESAALSELERVIRRCLEKDPAKRFADVRELAWELAPLGSSRARSSLEVIDGLAANEPVGLGEQDQQPEIRNRALETDATFTEAPTTREPTPDERPRHLSVPRVRAGSRVTAVLGAVLLCGIFLALRPKSPAEPTTPPTVAPSEMAGASEVRSQAESRPVPSPDIQASSTVVAERRLLSHVAASVPRKPARRDESKNAETPAAPAPSRSEPSQVDVLARAEELLGKGQISEACAVGQVAAATAPDSPRVLEFLGRCHMRLGAVEQARTYYRRYLEVAPSAPNAAFVRAMLEPRAQ